MNNPKLIIFFGDVGVGKTTLAERIARDLGYELVHFDNIMWLVTGKEKIFDEDDNFLLDIDEIQKVYDHMHSIAKYLLQQGKGVVLESMYFKEQRDQAVDIARFMKVPAVLVEVTCRQGVVIERVEKRKEKDPQTPGVKLYKKHRGNLGEEEREHLVIDTSEHTPDELVNQVKANLHKYLLEF